jgi:hypothetical protein
LNKRERAAAAQLWQAPQNCPIDCGLFGPSHAETLRTIAADPKHLGAEFGLVAVWLAAVWLAARQAELLPVPYYHVVLPDQPRFDLVEVAAARRVREARSRSNRFRPELHAARPDDRIRACERPRLRPAKTIHRSANPKKYQMLNS